MFFFSISIYTFLMYCFLWELLFYCTLNCCKNLQKNFKSESLKMIFDIFFFSFYQLFTAFYCKCWETFSCQILSCLWLLPEIYNLQNLVYCLICKICKILLKTLNCRCLLSPLQWSCGKNFECSLRDWTISLFLMLNSLTSTKNIFYKMMQKWLSF